MILLISNWTKANEGLMQGMWILNPLLEQFQFTWLSVNLKIGSVSMRLVLIPNLTITWQTLLILSWILRGVTHVKQGKTIHRAGNPGKAKKPEDLHTQP